MLIVKEFIKTETEEEIKEVPTVYSLLIGGIIGFVSGLIGVGGGIFLSPLIIMNNWTTIKNASGIAALFIFCNSAMGLVGHITSLNKIDSNVLYWIMAVVIGGYIGSHFGSIRLNNKIIISFLVLVLVSAGLKFIFVG